MNKSKNKPKHLLAAANWLGLPALLELLKEEAYHRFRSKQPAQKQ